MENAVTLPPTVRQQFYAVALRIRRLRVLKRVSIAAILLACIIATAAIVDLLVGIPNAWLRGLVGVLAFLITGAALFVLAALRTPERRSLAGLIESKHPELAERLTSAVLLAEDSSLHGSPALVSVLMEEADRDSRRVNAQQIVDARPTHRWLAGAGVCVTICLLAATLDARCAEFGERLLTSWFRPLHDFAIAVEPDSGAFAVGRPLTIAARLSPRSKRATLPLPRECFLIYRSGADEPQKLIMTPRSENEFVCLLTGPPANVEFHVEAADSQGEQHELIAVQPVVLLAESPVITVTPPRYANQQVHPIRELTRPADVTAFEYSDIRLSLQFNRTPLKAHLRIDMTSPLSPVLRGEGQRDSACVDVTRPITGLILPLTPDSSHRSAGARGVVKLPVLPAGRYVLSLHAEAEHGIATVQELCRIDIEKDLPPNLHVPMTASDKGISVPADDVLKVRYSASDAVGIDSIWLEYRVGDAVQVEKVTDGKGATAIGGEHRFRLRGKVKSGDEIRYRLKSLDNRQVPAKTQIDHAGRPAPGEDLLPQATFAPAENVGWMALSIEDAAEPLAKQNIAADRDRVRKWIEAIRIKVVLEKNQLDKFRRDSFHQPVTGPAQEKQLGAIRAQNRAVHADLSLFAHEASQDMLAGLANLAADIAAKEIDRAGAALARVAEKRAEDDARDRQVVAADTELAGALRRLDELSRQNEQLAQHRLDQLKLEELADLQQALAQRAAALATKPGPNPELDQLRAEQNRIAAELARLTAQSQLFQQAMRGARAEQMRRLGQQARALAKEQADLATAMRDELKQQLSAALLQLAVKQQALAAKVKDLRKQSMKTAADKTTPLLDATPSDRAATLLRKTDFEAALEQQTESAKELDRFAGDLSREQLFDPRAAADALAKFQALIRKNLEQLGKDLVKLSSEDTVKKLQEIAAQQRALAVELPKLANLNPKLTAELREASQRAADAVDKLQRADPLMAHGQMEKVEAALELLVRSLPDAEQYRQTMTAEFENLRRMQQKIVDGTGPREGLAKQQAEIIRRLGAIAVAPKHESLRKHLVDVLTAALAELRQGRPEKLQPMPAALSQLRGILLGQIHLESASPSPAAKHAAQAWKLEQEQLALRDELEKLLWSVPAASERLAQQKKLADKADQLVHAMKENGKSPEAMQFAQQAEEAMKHAAGEEKNAAMDAKEAAKMLGKAADKTEEMAKELGKDDMPFEFQREEMARTGEAVMQGQEKTEIAKKELSKPDTQAAPPAMQQAAEAISRAAAQAANQLAQQAKSAVNPMSANKPGFGSTPVRGVLLPEDLQQFTARPWGELPGTLRTQIIQDLRGRYGEEYARIIQAYFERIASEK